MKSELIFDDLFSEDSLNKIFYEYLSTSFATGIDHLTAIDLNKDLDTQIKIIVTKTHEHRYKFTPFKLKLISKGAKKPPREIAIPTIRDRLVLKAMNQCLTQIYSTQVSFEIPQSIIFKVKEAIHSKRFNYHVKLDVKDFYPSLRHDYLLQKLEKDGVDSRLIRLIEFAISNPTISREGEKKNAVTKGVAQGLSISNFLAALYMVDFDRKLNDELDIAYFRYVDDILILCNEQRCKTIIENALEQSKEVGLQIYEPTKNPEKSSIGSIESEISYLGYQFIGDSITVREQTISKLKDSIAAIFTAYHKSQIKSVEFLLWRLDLRVTGCVYENKPKGWLFFFAEINDEKILHELDHYVKKLKARFDLEIKVKRFARAFYEIKHNKYKSNYIPNFDSYTTRQKLELLKKYFPKDVQGKKLTEPQIDFHFSRRIHRQTKDLLEDVKDFKY